MTVDRWRTRWTYRDGSAMEEHSCQSGVIWLIICWLTDINKSTRHIGWLLNMLPQCCYKQGVPELLFQDSDNFELKKQILQKWQKCFFYSNYVVAQFNQCGLQECGSRFTGLSPARVMAPWVMSHACHPMVTAWINFTNR